MVYRTRPTPVSIRRASGPWNRRGPAHLDRVDTVATAGRDLDESRVCITYNAVDEITQWRSSGTPHISEAWLKGAAW